MSKCVQCHREVGLFGGGHDSTCPIEVQRRRDDKQRREQSAQRNENDVSQGVAVRVDRLVDVVKALRTVTQEQSSRIDDAVESIEVTQQVMIEKYAALEVKVMDVQSRLDALIQVLEKQYNCRELGERVSRRLEDSTE